MKAPEYFNETATEYFHFVVEELKNIDKLNPTDKPIIEALSFNLATLEDCQKRLFQEGFVVGALHGMKEHPAVSISMKAQAKVLESFKLLGLDASSRFKEEQVKTEDLSNDPLLNVLAGRAI
ncbi:phage terminase small subunit P27 family [Halobacillus litoralis]|uniref:Phage terminase small subunit P27 family n=1 Tax=Halobacillus litoralis TaxID=45668 RepID=A0A410MAU1_9BACI|nr:phage terminase small subunit P27 family [Halobacillus litoralis]QAS51827.1 phage terminase small subunit P27 family [Halobacillus litoralis]